VILDKVDGLRLLEHYDLRVARSGYVDSAENAIAFATRRTARDGRLVPIVMRTVVPGRASPWNADAVEGPLESEAAIRNAFAKLAAKVEATGWRILAQDAVDRGTDVTVDGGQAEKLGHKVVGLTTPSHSAQRTIPLDDAEAEELVAHFRELHRSGAGGRTRRMVGRLLVRASRLFAASGVDAFKLSPVRIHENSYTVLDAVVTSQRHIHVKERADHDEKAVGYVPSGRQ
jgi:hypothetical protein